MANQDTGGGHATMGGRAAEGGTGGAVAQPLKQIVYGTGTGVSSSPNATYDATPQTMHLKSKGVVGVPTISYEALVSGGFSDFEAEWLSSGTAIIKELTVETPGLAVSQYRRMLAANALDGFHWTDAGGKPVLSVFPNIGEAGGGSGDLLAANATEGFWYIPTIHGVPVGVPANLASFIHRTPIVYDDVTKQIYEYDFLTAAWVSKVGLTSVASADGSVTVTNGTGPAVDLSIVSGGPLELSNVLRRAQALLGPTIVKSFGTDFDTTNWIAAPTLGGSGSANLSTTERGGIINVKTGATGASSATIRPVGLGGLVINPTTELWYIRFRAAFKTTIDAQAYVPLSLDATSAPGIGLFIGGLGPVSTANFAYDFYNNSNVLTAQGSLGVALDTNYHVFEMWGDATNWRVAIDGTTRLTLAIPAASTNPCTARVDAFNQGTAANREVDVDDIVICTAA